MANNDWLRDEAVNFYLELLCCAPACVKNVLVETSYWCLYIVDSGFKLQWLTEQCNAENLGHFVEDSDDGEYKEVSGGQAKNTCTRKRLQQNYYDGVRYIVVPVNVSTTHWICVLIDLEKHRVSIADSCVRLKDSRENHKSVANVLIEWFKNGEEIWTTVVLNVVQQDSSFECGYFTIMHALYFMLGKDVEKMNNHFGTHSQILSFLTRLLIDLTHPVNKANGTGPLVDLTHSGDSQDDSDSKRSTGNSSSNEVRRNLFIYSIYSLFFSRRIHIRVIVETFLVLLSVLLTKISLPATV